MKTIKQKLIRFEKGTVDEEWIKIKSSIIEPTEAVLAERKYKIKGMGMAKNKRTREFR